MKNKNVEICIDDTEKKLGPISADKEDVIIECVRQLSDVQTYLKISKETLTSIITEIQNKLKRLVESHLYKGNCTKKEADFLLSKI